MAEMREIRSLRTITAWLVTVLLCAAAGARTIYVDDDAPEFGDGSSWETAYRYLQDALADANTAEQPVDIHVAQGLYRPGRSAAHPDGTGDREATFELINGVTLQGGYAGLGGVDPNARDVDRYETVLSGDLADNDLTPTARTTVFTRPTGRSRIDNSRHVVTILEAPSQVILDGFTITAAHCFLSAGRHATGSGGGINSYASHVAIRNCTFERNFAADRGAATYVEEGTVHVEDCVFTGNVASRGVAGEGGALACRRAHVTIIDTSFIANAAVTGGAVLGLDCPSLEISNCLFAGNVSFGTGAALASLGSQVALKQCTLSENGPSDALFGGSSDDRQASFRITGCIFPKDTISISKHFAVVAEVAYSNMFHGVIADPCNTLVWGPGNVNMEPFFADPGYWDSNGTPDERKDDFWVDGDYHLKSQAGRWDPASERWVQDDVTSPCIGAGDPSSLIGPEPFPNGGRINMGAYGGTPEASKSYFGGPPCETIIAGDINGDCRVDVKDFQILASHWLQDRRAAPSENGRAE